MVALFPSFLSPLLSQADMNIDDRKCAVCALGVSKRMSVRERISGPCLTVVEWSSSSVCVCVCVWGGVWCVHA